MYALMMAGGSGTRLWPKSRINFPKQLHQLISKRSLLADSILRIKHIISNHHTWLITNKNYFLKIREQIPQIPAENIITEPFPLGTALAVSLGMMRIYQFDQKAIVAVLWSDSHIKKNKNFIKTLLLARQVAQNEGGVIVGINPTFPATGYGYIEMGLELKKYGKLKVFKIKKFVEKPDKEKAKEFLSKWQYLWNSGISVWKVEEYIKLFKKLMPKHYKKLLKIKKYLNQTNLNEVLAKEFKNIDPLPIDYAIYEKAHNLAVIPADLGWSDIGNWSVLKDILNKKNKSNYINAKHIGLETKNCLIIGGERLITTIGIKNLVIIDTDDVILITDKRNCEKVKDLTQKIAEEGLTDYL